MAETITNNETKVTRLIFRPQIARQLLHMGNHVVDIKPDRTKPERSIFVFENDQKFQEDFNQILNDIQDQRQKERRKERKETVKESVEKEA